MSLTWTLARTIRTVAAAAALMVAAPALAAQPTALSAGDVRLYEAAFAAVKTADFATAEAHVAQTSDKLLAGYVEFEKLMHPTSYSASYAELDAWLASYADLPGADRAYNLARRRKPAGAAEPRMPMRVTGSSVARRASAGSPASREAFYKGDVARAYRLAVGSGERWIAGLAAFRLKNYAEAHDRFMLLADDAAEDDWLRAGASYWAARAAIADGKPEMAPRHLAEAARAPWTFYGLIAEAQLGLDPIAEFRTTAAASTDPIAALLQRNSAAPAPASDLSHFIDTQARARRAAALMQLGRRSEASGELVLGLEEAYGDEFKAPWLALSRELGLPADPAALQVQAKFNPSDYPAPPLNPKDGFTLSPALVYAIVRQESRFNPLAGSRVGAVGLMQLMPDAAARAAGDDKLLADMSPLLDSAFNLRVGQDYFIWLLERGVGDDMIKAIAAYNAGPSPLLRTVNQLGGDLDALMLIESLPAQETRNYVEQVLAAYWLYSRQFGEDAPSLRQVASGAGQISVAVTR